jgi:hypothetical protein
MICTEKGKKTLNVDHVIEALKQLGFDSHIKLLSSELDLSDLQNEDRKDVVIENSLDMKDLINKQKKRRKNKKKPEYNEDDEKEQLKLFEQSKIQNLQNYLNGQQEEVFISDGNLRTAGGIIGNKKQCFDDLGEYIVANTNKEEELDFDK